MRSDVKHFSDRLFEYYYNHIDELITMVETIQKSAHAVHGAHVTVLEDIDADSFNFVLNNVKHVLDMKAQEKNHD